MFDIFLDIPAPKFLKKLAEDPIPHNSKRIIGEKEKVFRIRVGKFRVLYRIDYENYHIVLINIDYRDRVYK